MTPSQAIANKKYAQSEKGKAAFARAGAKYYAKNKEKIEDKRLQKVYGINLDQWQQMFEDQGGCCALCDTHQMDMDRKLVVDHDHDTGVVRGLLCNMCNSALGTFGDNIEGLERAINYLRKN